MEVGYSDYCRHYNNHQDIINGDSQAEQEFYRVSTPSYSAVNTQQCIHSVHYHIMRLVIKYLFQIECRK